MTRLKTYFVLSVSVFVLLGAWLAWQAKTTPIYNGEKTVSYRFTLKNTTNRVLTKVEFWTYAPVKKTATQQCCSRLDVSHPYDMETDTLGNQVLHFRFDSLPPFADKVVRITATMQTASAPNFIFGENRELFLGKAQLIETDHADIKTLAASLVSNQLPQTAHKTFDWVAENVNDTGYLREQRGALYALQQKQGDCTESAYLFVALARANGIPARPVSGYYLENNGLLRADQFHEWAEFFDNGVWRIADPQKKVFDQGYANYIALHTVDSNDDAAFNFARFKHSGNGLVVTMN